MLRPPDMAVTVKFKSSVNGVQLDDQRERNFDLRQVVDGTLHQAYVDLKPRLVRLMMLTKMLL